MAGDNANRFSLSVRYYLIGRAGPSFTSYVGYLIPAIAVIIGAVWLGEAITHDKIAALAFILFGLLLAQKAVHFNNCPPS